MVAGVHDDVLVDRDEVLFDVVGDGIADEELAAAAGVAAQLDDAVDLGDFGGVLGHAGLEEFGDARQAAGDVLGTGLIARGLGDDGAGVDLGILGDDDVGSGGDGVGGEDVLAVGGVASRPPLLASPTPSSRRVLANLLAHRENGSFPMIGKKVSNGWKICAIFSNDWKIFFQWLENFVRFFQRLEKFFGGFPMIGKNFREAAKGTKSTKESGGAGGTREESGRESTRMDRMPLRGLEWLGEWVGSH